MVDGGDQRMLATEGDHIESVDVFLDCFSTTLLNLPGTGHVMSALGQRLHIEPASNGARGFEQNHYMILFLFQLLMHAVFHHSLSNFPNPLNFHDSSLCGR